MQDEILSIYGFFKYKNFPYLGKIYLSENLAIDIKKLFIVIETYITDINDIDAIAINYGYYLKDNIEIIIKTNDICFSDIKYIEKNNDIIYDISWLNNSFMMMAMASGAKIFSKKNRLQPTVYDKKIHLINEKTKILTPGKLLVIAKNNNEYLKIEEIENKKILYNDSNIEFNMYVKDIKNAKK